MAQPAVLAVAPSTLRRWVGGVGSIGVRQPLLMPNGRRKEWCAVVPHDLGQRALR